MISASLRDISTCLNAPVISTPFLLHDEPRVDQVEYGMGIRRGGISEYHGSPSLMVDVHEDMEPFLRSRQWALLPSFEVFRTIVELFVYNFNQLPSARRHFTEDLPEQEYDYQFLPVVDIGHRLLPFYLNDTLVQRPKRNILHVKSRVHPCFVIPILLFYASSQRSEKLSPNPVTEAISSLIDIYYAVTRLPVYVSWLGPRKTWPQFRRNFLLAKRDPPADRPPRYAMPVLPDSPTWSRKGKDAASRKPSNKKSPASLEKSAQSTGARPKKGRGRRNLNEEEEMPKPDATGMSTRRTVRSR